MNAFVNLLIYALICLVIAAAFSAILSACAPAMTIPPEPIIITKDVDRIVQVRCMDARPAAPDYPDDDAEIESASDIFSLALIYRAARALYRQRLQEDDVQIKACTGD